MSGAEELREARLSLSPPTLVPRWCPWKSLAGSAPGSADIFERARKNLKSAPELDSHRHARPVGAWVDQPELEGTDKLATNLKGFHGTFVKLQQARTFLHNASPAECQATIATLVELDGLTEKQGQQLKEELDLVDDKIEKITVVASYEFKEGDRLGSLEFHSDGGAIMSATAGKQTYVFTTFAATCRKRNISWPSPLAHCRTHTVQLLGPSPLPFPPRAPVSYPVSLGGRLRSQRLAS